MSTYDPAETAADGNVSRFRASITGTTRARMLTTLMVATFATGCLSAQGSDHRCRDLYQLADADHAVEPGVIVPATQTTPAHCQVRGVIDGSIRFEVSMPLEGWAGRMMFLAHGGNAGRIGDTKDLLSEGFAGVTTDSGHQGADNIDFIKDPLDLINFGFRANHLTTVLAKQVIAAFYEEPVQHAYLQGCSGGGRSALMEALRYPDDYDGIIAGAPTLGWIRATLPWAAGVARMQRQNPLTIESLSLLAANSRDRCDELDGVRDGLISRPQACTLEILDLEALRCADDPTSACLTEGQIQTARFIYDGLRNEAGEIVYNGIYPGDEDQGDWMLWVTGAPGMPATGYEGMVAMIENLYHSDPAFNVADFDPVNDQAELARLAAPVELPPPDFRRFHANAAKLIIYQGWQDAPLRARDTIEFLAEAAALSGGQATIDAFSRTYLVPNMLHCGGGTGGWAADYVSPMVNWVENGVVPSAIVGTNPGISHWLEAIQILEGSGVSWYRRAIEAGATRDPSTRSTRLLCPYPETANYSGSGALTDASNYRCTTPN